MDNLMQNRKAPILIDLFLLLNFFSLELSKHFTFKSAQIWELVTLCCNAIYIMIIELLLPGHEQP